ncbi:MAG TPA: hypothetical protein VFD82_21880 [Planctomycetota bacterium]|nr:hypothetical protein [Planctomycetota bacterium]
MTATTLLPPDSLLGADVAIVAAQLGPPLHCKAVRDEVHLAYVGQDGRCVSDGVVLVDGVVVRVSPVRRSPPSIHGDWIGQPIERVLPCFGEVLAVAHDPALQELTFAAWRVFVHEGRCVLAQPRT